MKYISFFNLEIHLWLVGFTTSKMNEMMNNKKLFWKAIGNRLRLTSTKKTQHKMQYQSCTSLFFSAITGRRGNWHFLWRYITSHKQHKKAVHHNLRRLQSKKSKLENRQIRRKNVLDKTMFSKVYRATHGIFSRKFSKAKKKPLSELDLLLFKKFSKFTENNENTRQNGAFLPS